MSGRLTIASKTDVGMRRSENQDSMLVQPVTQGSGESAGHLLVVADGVGGLPGGASASATAIRVLAEAANDDMVSNPQESFHICFLRANEEVRRAAGDNTDLHGMATTLTAAFVNEGQAWLANVGDSRIYMIRDHNAWPLTHDHSWVTEQVDAGLMTKEQAANDPRRNMITRAIGIEADVLPDVYQPVPLEDGDIILLCSDGLYGVVEETELASMASAKPPIEAVEDLVALANSRGGPDNITVVLAVWQADTLDLQAATAVVQAETAAVQAETAETVQVPTA